MALTGDLQVTVDTSFNSWWAAEVMRTGVLYVVRDSRLAVVHKGVVGERPIALTEGLYSVDVVTPSGIPATSVVSVAPGRTTHVRIADEGATGESAAIPPGLVLGGIGVNTSAGLPGWTREFEGRHVEFDRPPEVFEILGTRNCRDRRWLNHSSVEIEPTPPLVDVPTAQFRLGTRRLEMSLPLNSRGRPETWTCWVSRVREYGEDRLRMSFGPERELCTMMDGLLRHNTAHSAVGLLEAATNALRAKYADPAGAALGGLTLHSMGRLTERERWVENLARDFQWLPDGRILRAALLMKVDDEKERTEGWGMLLDATAARPLYTDGLSLGMELLRRWPDQHSESDETRKKRLQFLGYLAAHAEWGCLNLTTRLE